MYKLFFPVLVCSLALLVSVVQLVIIGVQMQESSQYASAQEGESFEYRGYDYIETDLGNGTKIWRQQIGVPLWLDSGQIDERNGKPVFVPYRIQEEGDTITYETGSVSWTFDKGTCSFRVFPGGDITESTDPIIDEVQLRLLETPADTEDWQPSDANVAPCNVSLNTLAADPSDEFDGEGVELVATQTDSNGIGKEVRLVAKGGRELETWLKVTNNDSSKTNHKFGWEEIQTETQDVKTKGQAFGLSIAEEKRFDKAEMRQVIDLGDGNTQVVDELITIEKPHGVIHYNHKDSVHDALTDVVVKKANSSQLQTIVSFKNFDTLPVGQSQEVDPTYSSNNPTVDGWFTKNTSTVDCLPTNTINTGDFFLYFNAPDGGTGNCIRSFIEWDVTSIPNGIVSVDNIVFKYEMDDYHATPSGCDLYLLDTKPTTFSISDGNKITSGTLISDGGSWCATEGPNLTFDLGITANSTILSSINGGQDWVGFGLKVDNESVGSGGRRILSEENGSATPKPTLEITYTEPCVPDAPTSPSAESSSTSQINISWTAPTDCTNQATEVQQSPNGSTGWTTIYSSTPKTSHSDTGLSSNEDYFYRIRYQSNTGDFGSYSTTVSDFTTPAAPAGLSVTTTSNSAISTSWNAVSGSGTVTYDVERRAGTSGASTCSGFGSWSVVSNNQSGTSFNDSGLTETTCYEYRVNATNSDSTSNYSTTANDITFPDPPTGLSATATSSSQVNLSWSAPSGTVDGYHIERKVGAGSWNTLVADTGNTNTTHSDTGLSPTTLYTYRVSSLNGADSSTPSNESADTTFPDPPTGLSATITSDSQIDLSWSAPVSGSVDGYKIERESPTGGGFSVLVADTGNTNTTYADTGLSPTTEYNYRVSSLNGADSSTPSNTASGTTFPGSPTGLSATAASSSQVNLSWSAPTGSIDSYRIARKGTFSSSLVSTIRSWFSFENSLADAGTLANDASVTGSELYESDGVVSRRYDGSSYDTISNESNYDFDVTDPFSIAFWYKPTTNTPPSNEMLIGKTNGVNNLGFSLWRWAGNTNNVQFSFADGTNVWTVSSGAFNDTAWRFIVATYDGSGNRNGMRIYVDGSLSSTGSPSTSVTTILNNNSVTIGRASTAVNWYDGNLYDVIISDSEYDADQVTELYEKTWALLISDTGDTSTTYADTGLTANESYCYQVSTLAGGDVSSPSNQSCTETIPSQVTGLAASAVSESQIDLSWDNVAGDDENGYRIEVNVDGGGWTTRVANTGNQDTTYADTGLTANESYQYRVSAISDGGIGLASTAVTEETIPSQVTGLAASVVSESQIDLSWDNVAGDDENGYRIERRTCGGSWSVIVADTGDQDTTYADTGLDSNTCYGYRVSAISDGGIGTASTEDTTHTIPDAPTSLTTDTVSVSQVNLSWTAPSGTITGYKVEERISTNEACSDGSFTTKVADTGSSGTTYEATSLSANTCYTYRVSAIGNGGTGAVSNTSFSTTIASAPTNLTVTTISHSRIDLSWTTPGGNGVITGYVIERESPVGGGFSIIISDTGTTATTYVDTSLNPQTEYNYRVSAINSGGTSTASSASSTTTKITPSSGTSPTPTLEISSVNVEQEETSAILSWESNLEASSSVSWGTSATSLGQTTSTLSPRMVHEVVLEDLSPSAEYFYKVTLFTPTAVLVTPVESFTIAGGGTSERLSQEEVALGLSYVRIIIDLVQEGIVAGSLTPAQALSILTQLLSILEEFSLSLDS